MAGGNHQTPKPPTNIDEVLTTTRAVRLRLDFDRPVERVVETCARLAFRHRPAARRGVDVDLRRRPVDGQLAGSTRRSENIERSPVLLVPTVTRKYPAADFGAHRVERVAGGRRLNDEPSVQPDQIESMEAMVEGTLVLCDCGPVRTGASTPASISSTRSASR